MQVSSLDRLRSRESARLSDLSPQEILQSSCNAMRRVKAHVHTVPLKIANLCVFIEMGIRSNQEDVSTCAMFNVQGCARLLKIDSCVVAAAGAGAKYVLRLDLRVSSLVERIVHTKRQKSALHSIAGHVSLQQQQTDADAVAWVRGKKRGTKMVKKMVKYACSLFITLGRRPVRPEVKTTAH